MRGVVPHISGDRKSIPFDILKENLAQKKGRKRGGGEEEGGEEGKKGRGGRGRRGGEKGRGGEGFAYFP